MKLRQNESEEMELRPLVKKLVVRIDRLEVELERVKVENRSVQQLIRAPVIRGPYQVRGEGEVPQHGFGQLDTDFFVTNLKKTNAFYLANVGHSVLNRNIEEFISAVCWIANGRCHVVKVSFGTRLNRNGNPTYVELNFKKRRRKVTLEAAVMRFFESPFLPGAEAVENELGKVPAHIRKGLQFYTHYCNMRPSKVDRKKGSWQSKVDLLIRIAQYKVPEREKRISQSERGDQYYKNELDEVGRWWLQPRAWSMQKIVETYDEILKHSGSYKTELVKYFELRPERRREYHTAGGTLV